MLLMSFCGQCPVLSVAPSPSRALVFGRICTIYVDEMVFWGLGRNRAISKPCLTWSTPANTYWMTYVYKDISEKFYLCVRQIRIALFFVSAHEKCVGIYGSAAWWLAHLYAGDSEPVRLGTRGYPGVFAVLDSQSLSFDMNEVQALDLRCWMSDLCDLNLELLQEHAVAEDVKQCPPCMYLPVPIFVGYANMDD